MNSWQETVSSTPPNTGGAPACALCDLSHLGLIRVSGTDSRRFLQGQLTNDVNQVTGELAQLSSHCSPKGRMLGSFWIFQRGDDLYLQLPRERLPAILKRLQMFVLRAAVTLDDVSDALARFGIAGECAESLLPFAPTAPKATLTRDGITVLRLPGDRPRFEVVGTAAQLTPLWSGAAERAQVAEAGFWSLLDIRAGVPTVLDDTAEAFVPQMTNLQLIGGISFTKGCYTGQEVVARMQYLGKLKRRMYRARIGGDEFPAPGTELYSASSESGQGAGRVVDAAISPDGGYEALVVLQISSAEAGDVHVRDAAGPSVQLLGLPYAFPTEDA
ncbi:MAG: folate-binding protein YgfZ [Chromatiaceae bacterium]|nr:folate-binding protein YgfZ [Chromatiaceae bacterium]